MTNEENKPSTDKTPIGEIIKNFRTWRGVTQQEMADYLDKSKSVISNWERGTNSPDVESCMGICKLLNITLDELVGWKKNKDYEKFIEDQEAYDQELSDLQKQIEEFNERIKDIEQKKEKKVPRPPKDFFDLWGNSEDLPFN